VVENFYLYFDPKVTAKVALSTIEGLLPTDARQTASYKGVNPDYSKIGTGECQQVIYTSQQLGVVVRDVNPKWPEDPDNVSVTLYSGNISDSDGSEKPYDGDSVHIALVMLGTENRGTDGIVHC
jgi:hypothetical protein